jgi:hypothetical protein
MLPLGYQHLYLRQVLGLAMGLHRGTHGVLEQLKQYVVKMWRRVD